MPPPIAVAFGTRLTTRLGERGTSTSVGALIFVVRSAMDLHVKFDGHEIIVTRPGTDMMTAYRKRPDSPNLVLTRSWGRAPPSRRRRSASFAPTPFRPQSPRRASWGGLCGSEKPGRGGASRVSHQPGTVG